MLKYDELSENQQELYDSLKDAIKNNSNIADVLKKYNDINMVRVLRAANSDEDILMVYAIKENVETAKTIFNYAKQLHEDKKFADQTKIGAVTDILANKALYAILNNENETAKKIIEFSDRVDERFIANTLKGEFKKAIKSGDKDGGFDKANKFYAFGERNQLNIFEDELLQSSWLSDTISEIKRNKNTQFLENTLKFAENNNILDEVFKAEIGSTQKTLLEFAEEEGVKEEVEGVISDAGISIDEYRNKPADIGRSDSFDEVEDDDNNQQSTFCSRNKGKIACGVVGSFLLAGCIVAVCTLGQPLIGVAAIGAVAAAVIGAAMLLVSVLAITTDRGYEMWGSAGNMLSDLFVSQQGSKKQEI